MLFKKNIPTLPRPNLGIIAGSGQFPFMVARHARDKGMHIAASGFTGFTDPTLASHVDVWEEMKLGQLNRLIHFFKDRGITSVCFAGAISKPKAMNLRPDFRAAKMLLSTPRKGDSHLLLQLIREFEADGLSVIQAADIIPELRGPLGVLSRRSPTKDEWIDLAFGWQTAKTLGPLDIGQTIVVTNSMVAAVEALEGTDEAILRGGKLSPKGAVAVKIVKPGQDERIDLPALGIRTIENCAKAGVTCLGFEAGKTLLFDSDGAIQTANAHSIALVGLDDATIAKHS